VSDEPKQQTQSESKGEPKGEPGETAKKKPEPRELRSVTQGTLLLDGRSLAYTATASTLLLRDAEDEARASVFSVAYTLDATSAEQRPVTFCFNGGPGSSAVWLHLGAFGPKRAAFADPQHPPPPPYRLEDNDASLLDVSDLVFVDPVGTGYSRVAGSAKAEEFQSVQGDVDSMADFVRLWLTRNRRWNSAKLLCGESYGGTRVAALAATLQDRGIFLNGVVLVSPALDFQALEFQPGNDLPSVLYLPSYAVTARYHGQLAPEPADLAAFLAEVRAFAYDVYAPALMRGAKLSESERRAVLAKLVAYTGLPEVFLAQNALRIDNMRFGKELLRARGLVVGRLDSRFTGAEDDAGGAHAASDPSYSAPLGPYTALMNVYLRDTLLIEEDRAYEILSMKVNEAWKWELPKGRTGGYTNVVASLRRAMLDNPRLRVLFASGYYDLATPFFAAEHAAQHLGLEPQLRANVSEAFYEAGHMMYLHAPSRAKLRADLLAFFAAAAPSA